MPRPVWSLGPLAAPALSLFSSFRCSPPLPSARVSSVHYSSRCSLPETGLYVRATLLLISSPPLSVAPYAFTIHAVSYFGPGCEDEVVPRKRSGMLTVARVLRDVETRQCDDTIIKTHCEMNGIQVSRRFSKRLF